MFNLFMSRGEISNAICLLSDEHKGGVLATTYTVDRSSRFYATNILKGNPWSVNAFKANNQALFPTIPLFLTKSVRGSSESMQCIPMAGPGLHVWKPMTGVDYFLVPDKSSRTVHSCCQVCSDAGHFQNTTR